MLCLQFFVPEEILVARASRPGLMPPPACQRDCRAIKQADLTRQGWALFNSPLEQLKRDTLESSWKGSGCFFREKDLPCLSGSGSHVHTTLSRKRQYSAGRNGCRCDRCKHGTHHSSREMFSANRLLARCDGYMALQDRAVAKTQSE